MILRDYSGMAVVMSSREGGESHEYMMWKEEGVAQGRVEDPRGPTLGRRAGAKGWLHAEPARGAGMLEALHCLPTTPHTQVRIKVQTPQRPVVRSHSSCKDPISSFVRYHGMEIITI